MNKPEPDLPINGVGKIGAAILVAEIGDVSRFPTPQHLCWWCGLTPKHRESDLKTRRGRISKQGSRLVRAKLIEGISRYHGGSVLDAQYRRSPNDVAATRPAWRCHAKFSRSSITACATARSDASRRPRLREARTRPGCELDDRHDPPLNARRSPL
jgi:hypothetical protein